MIFKVVTQKGNKLVPYFVEYTVSPRQWINGEFIVTNCRGYMRGFATLKTRKQVRTLKNYLAIFEQNGGEV